MSEFDFEPGRGRAAVLKIILVLTVSLLVPVLMIWYLVAQVLS